MGLKVEMEVFGKWGTSRKAGGNQREKWVESDHSSLKTHVVYNHDSSKAFLKNIIMAFKKIKGMTHYPLPRSIRESFIQDFRTFS